MKRFKFPQRVFLAGIVVCSALIVFSLWFYQKHPLTATVTVGGKVLPVELAITDTERNLGLGNREFLEQGTGMLFVYDHKEQYMFWMKNMQFPLDFIWLDGNEIVDITENVPVETNGKTTAIAPKREVDKVLELNAGDVSSLGVKIGDTVIFNK